MRTETLTFCALCGAYCAAKATVEDGKIVKWEQDKQSGFHYLPCPSFKGRFNGEISENPDRLKHPLRRTGARGEGKWQRISWDEALDTIANKLTEIKEKYAPSNSSKCSNNTNKQQHESPNDNNQVPPLKKTSIF